jgi:hypothetical protein
MRKVITVAGAVLALGFIPLPVPTASANPYCDRYPAGGGRDGCEEGCKLAPEACGAAAPAQPVPAYQEPSQNDPNWQGSSPAQAPPAPDDPVLATANPGVVPGNPPIPSLYFAPAQPEGCDWYNVVCWWGKLWGG